MTETPPFPTLKHGATTLSERQAQLNEYAQRHEQDPASALDEVLATALEWERQDYQGAIEGIRRGYEAVKAGNTRPASDFLNELREKHGGRRMAL